MTTSYIYGAISTTLMMVGSGYYLFQVVTGKLKPHFFTLLVWTVVTCLVASGFMAKGIGAASWRTVALAVMLIIGTTVSLKNGLGYVKRFDIGVLLLTLLAIPLWIVTDNPDVSIIWVLVIEVAGTLPAIRKAWLLPHEEGVVGLLLNAASNGFSLLALNSYPFSVVLYLSTWGLVLAMLSAIALYRRRALPSMESML